MEIFKTGIKVCVPDYPYGSLRTQMWFWTEFKDGKGYRQGKQSLNPKTGQFNKPNYSTYGYVCGNYKCTVRDENGFVGYEGFDLPQNFEAESWNKTLPWALFVYKNWDALQIPKEEMQYIVLSIVNCMKLSYGHFLQGKSDEVKSTVKANFTEYLNQVRGFVVNYSAASAESKKQFLALFCVSGEFIEGFMMGDFDFKDGCDSIV